MAQLEKIIDLANFSEGFTALEDTTKAAFGSFRKMRNARVTDRFGIGPRPGTRLIGEKKETGSATCGFYNFKRSFEENEIMLRAYGDRLEGFSKDHADQGWFTIKTGFTNNKEFGFVHSLFNKENKDLLLGSNRFDPFFAYEGSIATTTAAVASGDTAVPVSSTLLPDIFASETASDSSPTTLTIENGRWVANQWNGFYVLIKSGSEAGSVRKITNTETETITFETLGTNPGRVDFEIRRTRFADSGTVIYNDQTIEYTKIQSESELAVSDAHAAPAGTVVTQSPKEYPGNPRGNRFTNYLGRTIVGNVRSALALNDGGTSEGFASGGSFFVSKLNNPVDFNYSAPRRAGDGDIVSTPYGGGNITDVAAQENAAYIFKDDYIEAVSYSQDANDVAIREPLKTGIGSAGKITHSADDIYFMTNSKQLSTIGRVSARDVKPQTLNIGNRIKRWLDRSDPSEIGRGVVVAEKVYIPLKSREQATSNDVVLIYNQDTQSFEGIWDIAAFGLQEFAGKYYYAESGGANVFQMFTDRFADVEGDTPYGYTFEVETHFFNLSASKGYQQSMNGLVIEGYIRGGTQVTYNIWKDFQDTPTVQFTFDSDEDGFMNTETSQFYLGDTPLGINSLTVDYSDIDNDGRRHFMVRTYFPFTYGNFFSVGIQSSGIDQDHETTRFGLMIKETPTINSKQVKNI